MPLHNQKLLVVELEEDPFAGHVLSTAVYGMYLAPLTAAMTTAKHRKFKQAPRLDNLEDGAANTTDFVCGNAIFRDDRRGGDETRTCPS